MSRTPMALLLCLVAPSCAAADAPIEPRGSAARAAPAPAPAPALFEFHSSFWVNVHHRLHYAATGRRPPPALAPPQPSAPAWTAAVDFYKGRFAERGGFGLLFDEELLGYHRRLSQLGSAPLAGIAPEVATHLQAAGDVVRPEWLEQDRANQAWITAMKPLLERHGKALQADLTAFYRAPWPPSPIRVDVSSFAGPVGAYTVLDPVHITITSADPSYTGEGALEMIFHEASHALVEPIEKKIEAHAAARGRKAPRDLWHAVLFYSTGEIVKRRLGPEYVPYATKNGLWKRWESFEAALRREWQPHLDGRTDMDAAIAALVDAVPDDRPEPH